MERVVAKASVVGFYVYRIEASQKELNKFELSNKTVENYIVLSLASIVPGHENLPVSTG